MGERFQPAAGALLLLLLVVAAPPVEADHCATGIVIYGRAAFTPGILLPPTPRICIEVETSSSAGHILPPETDEIFVRVQTDIGTSYPVLQLRLEGLGFDRQTYPLTRAEAVAGMWVYDVADWLALPDDDPHGTLRAAVRFPGEEAAAEYTLLELPDPETLASEYGP